MKSIITILLIILLAIPVKASSLNNIKIQVNGDYLDLDVAPIIKNGLTMIPMRSIFEALDAEVIWNDDTRVITAKQKNTNIECSIDLKKEVLRQKKTIFNADGTFTIEYFNINLDDNPPIIIDGKTLVSTRIVAESFGADVKWNIENRTVVINSKQ